MSLPSKELSDSALDALIARERTRVMAPLTEWRTLTAELRAEGLLRVQDASAQDASAQTMYEQHRGYDAAPSAAPTREALVPRRSGIMRWSTRFVAGAVLLGTGIVVGRGMTLGQEIVSTVKHSIVVDSVQTVAGTPAHPFRSDKEATVALVRAQDQYQRAAAYLAARDTTAQIVIGPEAYQQRLAALDQLLAMTREKLETTPGDPVLTQYYQSVVGAREGTLQQLGRTLPAGARLAQY